MIKTEFDEDLVKPLAQGKEISYCIITDLYKNSVERLETAIFILPGRDRVPASMSYFF
jgi:hypothetical protein